MSFSIEKMNDKEFRIADEEGAACYVRIAEERARILSLFVPEMQRKNGVGNGLLQEAEQLAAAKNVKLIECDFRSDLESVMALLQKRGYEITEGNNLISVNTKELVSSTGVVKSLRVKLPNAEMTRFSDMMLYQIEEVGDFLRKINIDLDKDELSSFNEDLSCVVYDNDYKTRAVLLTTVREEEIFVDLLVGFSKKSPQYVLAVCQEFVRALVENDMVETHPRIVVFAIREEVIALFKRLLDKQYELSPVVGTRHAGKAPGQNNDEVSFTEGEYVPWEEDILDIAYQCSISEKQWWLKTIK